MAVAVGANRRGDGKDGHSAVEVVTAGDVAAAARQPD